MRTADQRRLGIDELLFGASEVAFRGSRYPELLRLYRPESAQHIVQFYEDELVIIENVAFLSLKALTGGHSTVLVATETHLQDILTRMTEFGGDPEKFRKRGRFVTAEATEALSRFMVNGVPEWARFQTYVGEILRKAQDLSSTGFVFAFGEMVALLCNENKPEAAIRLEQLWNFLAKQHRFSLYCAYSLSCLGSRSNASNVVQICSEHAMTIPCEGYV